MRTIFQKIRFNAKPEALYGLYVEAKKHSAATGGKVVMSGKVGGAFSAHGGYIKGKNLLLAPGRMIVQSWRGKDWSKGDRDSVLILRFEKAGRGGVVHMIHANVPDRFAKALERGWKTYYWKPWKRYLSWQE